MKFIFPQNYDLKNKLFGWIDYTTAIIDAIWCLISYGGVNLLKIGLNIKIFVFIVLVMPVLIFSIIGFNGEDIVQVLKYLIKYMIKPKVLLYKK